MQEIKSREFQRLFSQVTKQYKSLMIWNQDGVQGYWLSPSEFNDLQNRVRHAEESLKTALEGSVVSDIEESLSDTIVEEPKRKCPVCHARIYDSWYSGTYWNEGEDMKIDICVSCYRRNKPIGFKLNGKPLPKRTRR